MNTDQKPPKAVEKIPSGIEGFDDLTAGGLPRGRTTLIMGGPGCGKTVLALQALVNGAVSRAIPGIFIAFEENADLVRENGESFGWDIAGLQKRLLYFLNAQFPPDVVKAGAFDLTGLLAGLEAKAREMGAKLVVFDSLDVLLNLLDDRAAERREFYRIQAWLKRTGLTGIMTTKVVEDKSPAAQRYGFMPFMADCVILLYQRVFNRVAVREMRVVKYRGSPHALNEVPFLIGAGGIEVGTSNGVHPEPRPFKMRVSTRIARLDKTLVDGIYSGTNVLITGRSGSGNSSHGAYVFRIYIADGTPNSVRALANLYAVCHKHFPSSHRIEVIDILQEPLRALGEGILVTPTVVKLSPAPSVQMIGNLSDEEEVLRALGLPQKENE